MIRNYRRALAAISSAALLALAPQAQAQSNTATGGGKLAISGQHGAEF